MVLDSLNHTGIYEKINPLFKKAFDYIQSVDIKNLQVGKIQLDENISVAVSDSNLKNENDAKLELHNQYIDIQIPIDKTEKFGWKGRSELKMPHEPFNIAKDIQFFDDKIESIIPVNPGNFVIFWPEDAHAPCIGEGKIRKIVIKIKILG